MDSRIPQTTRAYNQIVALLRGEGDNFTAEQRAVIRAELDRPSRNGMDRFVVRSKGRS